MLFYQFINNMLTEKDYCDYETCVTLKELGYDGYCAAYYHLFDDDEDARNSFEYAYGFDFQNSNNIYRVGAPLLYQAQKWLREEKKIDVGATWDNDEYNWYVYIKKIGFPDWSGTSVSHSCYSSYEEALSEGIKEAVKILKGK